MKYRTEHHNVELEHLQLRLAESEAERDRIQQELAALKSSLTSGTSTALWRRTTVAVAGVLAAASLLSAAFFHDAQSSVKTASPLEPVSIDIREPGLVLRDRQGVEGASRTSRGAGQKKTRFKRARKPTEQQWGPPLVMPETEAGKRYYGFDPIVREQQKDLLTLGFDVGGADGYKGLRTQHAIAEFRALYLPESGEKLRDADLAVVMDAYANLARADAARYGIDTGIVAAIRLSSVRTGVDFSYMMKLAATESNFEPESEAATSSATGLYQFTHDTWLNVLKASGAAYGLVADYAADIEYYKTRFGYQRPFVRDDAKYQHLLELRKNPRLAAMMAAEAVRDYQQQLAQVLEREPTETDLYLTHFLGPEDAITFLQSLEQNPGTHAVELFPEAAISNQDIFHPKTCDPHTVNDVYALFEEKFSARRFEQPGAVESNDRSANIEAPRSSVALKKPAAFEWNRGRAL